MNMFILFYSAKVKQNYEMIKQNVSYFMVFAIILI